MLNPIENIWSKVKTEVKNSIRIPIVSPPGVGEQRLVYLEEAIDEAKALISGGDCGRAVVHAASFYTDAMNCVDMRVGA